jgi:carbon storage regulator
MLVLTRKVGERVLIGDVAVIEVLEVQGRRVRFGIQAPQGVKVLRQELVTAADTQAPPGEADPPLAAVP